METFPELADYIPKNEPPNPLPSNGALNLAELSNGSGYIPLGRGESVEGDNGSIPQSNDIVMGE